MDAPNGNGNGNRAERIVDSLIGKIIARYIMPPLATAFIAMAGWYLAKQNNAIERLQDLVVIAIRDQALVQQQITLRAKARDDQLSDINGRIEDHETRIRVIERFPPIRGTK